MRKPEEPKTLGTQFALIFFRMGVVSGLCQVLPFCISSVSSASSVVILPRSGSNRRDTAVRLLPAE